MKTTLSKDGTTLAYDVHGTGRPLIFIAGAACFRSFEPVLHTARTLARKFAVYNYDRRGRGDSSDTPPYAIEREIEDVEAMIDAAGGAACLYGHSSGAILALEAAMRLGAKVDKLVLYDPSYANDEANQNEFKELGQEIISLLDHGRNDEALSQFLEGIGIPKEVIAGMQYSSQWATMTALAPTLAYDIALAGDLAPIGRVSRLATPTHIMIGEVNPASMHEVGDRLSKAIPNAKYGMVAGQDHLPDPEVLLPMISGFLRQ